VPPANELTAGGERSSATGAEADEPKVSVYGGHRPLGCQSLAIVAQGCVSTVPSRQRPAQGQVPATKTPPVKPGS